MITVLNIIAGINYAGSAIVLLMSFAASSSPNSAVLSAIMFLVAVVATIGSDVIESLNYLVKCASANEVRVANDFPVVDK